MHDLQQAGPRVLYADEELQLGEFICPTGDPRWSIENDIGDGFHVVFPWTPVAISRDSMPSMVATANHAVLYTPGLHFRRRYLSNEGDHCLFAVLSTEMCARLGLSTGRPPADPALSPSLWLAQRLLAEYLRDEGHDPALVGRLGRHLIASTLASMPSCKGEPAGRAVEQTKELMALTPGQLLPLKHIAEVTHYSRFHLLRAFRARTGYTLHQFHLELRLRHSVDLVLAGRPLAEIAHTLGFQGHSHFTARFRRSFGRPPSALREGLTSPGDVSHLIGELLPVA
jgi:AraC-like DNA-binding protein